MYSVVVLAAGSGSRCGLGYNKLLHKINGRMILEYTLDNFECNDIILVVSEKDFQAMKDHFPQYKICLGGKLRQDSVKNGVKLATYNHVLIHDGARMFVNSQVISNVASKLNDYNAVVPCVKLKDSVKDLDGNSVNRDSLMIAQTPQGVKRDLYLKYALESDFELTDDVSLFECFGESVKIVEGDYANIKITTRDDLDYAKFKMGG